MGLGKRHELTDAAWAVLEPLLPVQPRRRGRASAGDQRHPLGLSDGRAMAGCAGALRAVADAL